MIAYVGEWDRTVDAGAVIRENRERYRDIPEAAVTAGSLRSNGQPAPISSGEETKRALQAGAGIVFRLPSIAVLGGPNVQAFATLTLADRLGGVTLLAAPVTRLDAEQLRELAMFLFKEPMPYQKRVRELMAEGLEFQAARAKGTEAFIPGAEAVLAHPLDSYAVELQLAAMRRFSSVKIGLLRTEFLPEEAASQEMREKRDRKLAGCLSAYIRERSDKALLSEARMTPNLPWSVSEKLLSLREELPESRSFLRMAEHLSGGKAYPEQVRCGLLMLLLGIRLPNQSIAGLEAFGPYIRVAGLTEESERRAYFEALLGRSGTPVIPGAGMRSAGIPLDESLTKLASFDLAADRLWEEITGPQ